MININLKSLNLLDSLKILQIEGNPMFEMPSVEVKSILEELKKNGVEFK